MGLRSIAVTGASGNIGGAVVNGLLDAGHENVIALARNPARLGALRSMATDVDPQEFCERLLREGVSPWWAYAFTGMFESVSEHRFETVTDHVMKLTGRAATPFRAVVQRALRF